MNAALQAIFNHLRKIRNTKYPIQRALRLVEAISRDLVNQMLKVLGTRRLMHIGFDEFEKVHWAWIDSYRLCSKKCSKYIYFWGSKICVFLDTVDEKIIINIQAVQKNNRQWVSRKRSILYKICGYVGFDNNIEPGTPGIFLAGVNVVIKISGSF
jgi:hypothetical protein